MDHVLVLSCVSHALWWLAAHYQCYYMWFNKDRLRGYSLQSSAKLTGNLYAFTMVLSWLGNCRVSRGPETLVWLFTAPGLLWMLWDVNKQCIIATIQVWFPLPLPIPQSATVKQLMVQFHFIAMSRTMMGFMLTTSILKTNALMVRQPGWSVTKFIQSAITLFRKR